MCKLFAHGDVSAHGASILKFLKGMTLGSGGKQNVLYSLGRSSLHKASSHISSLSLSSKLMHVSQCVTAWRVDLIFQTHTRFSVRHSRAENRGGNLTGTRGGNVSPHQRCVFPCRAHLKPLGATQTQADCLVIRACEASSRHLHGSVHRSM